MLRLRFFHVALLVIILSSLCFAKKRKDSGSAGDIALNEKNANNFWSRHRRDVATAAPGCPACPQCPELCEELREEHT